MELPQLQDLWSEITAERDDVVFLCINIEDPKERIAKYWEDSSFTMQAVRQRGSDVSDAFGVVAYPTNYVIGPDGDVLYREVLYDEAAIRDLLGLGKDDE